MTEKVLLTLDNGLRDTQDCVEPLLDVLDQPARLLQLLLQPGRAGLTLRATQDLRIHIVDAQPRHHIRIELRDPAAATLAHEHVRHHEVGFRTAVCMARVGRQRADQFVCGLQCHFIDLQRFLQPRVVAYCEQLQVVGNDVQRQFALRVLQAPQLQGQAFGGVARAHAGRVEALQQREDGVDFVDLEFEFFRQLRADLFKRRAQVAIVVERFDQEDGQALVARRDLQRRELFHQVLAQRGLGFAQLHRRFFVLVALRAAGKVVQAPVAAAIVVAVAAVAIAVIVTRAVGAGLAIALGLCRGGRRCALQVDRAIGRHAQRAFDPVVLALEQRVFRQRLFDLLLQFQRGELQQPDRLLQLRGQGQMLGKTEL
ncbi:hypothetical protein D9M72_418260 [compost metagenome]